MKSRRGKRGEFGVPSPEFRGATDRRLGVGAEIVDGETSVLES